jgi:hypothetical protein
MAAFVVLIAMTVVFGVAFGGFLAACRSIRRVDRRGTLRPPALQRRVILAYAARWDDNTSALA